MAKPFDSSNVARFCEAILLDMSTLQSPNYAFTLGKMTGMLDAITSDEINDGVDIELLTTMGGEKLREARVIYDRRSKHCDIQTGSTALAASICDTPFEDDEGTVTVAITDRIASRTRQFSASRMHNICENKEMFIRKFLMSDMRALREQLDLQIFILVDAGAGVLNLHAGGTVAAGDSKTTQLLTTVNEQSIPLMGNFVDMKLDYSGMEFGSTPVMVGDGNLHKYFTLANLSCCNGDNIPFEASLSNSGTAFFLDQLTTEAIGLDQMLMIAPGASSLLWFNKNHSIDINNELESHIVVPDPVNPKLFWDWDFFWDKCAGDNSQGAWIYQLSAFYEVFNTFQADAFQGSTSPTVSPDCDDDLNAVTGIWKYVITDT